MKKFLMPMLTTALMVGAGSTTFAAAANPFSDVPRGHWAYDAVTQLAADGIIEGYGDGTFLGNRNITRYEMAQMVAKALARNPQGTDRAAVDRLAAEFADELSNLGVRVSELEKYADKVTWNGKIEYEYDNIRTDPDRTGHKDKTTNNGYIFRFEPSAEVNDHWTLHARIDSYVAMKDNSSEDFNLVRGWAEGNYKNFNVKIGKQEFWTNESSLVWDTDFSGVIVGIGDKFKTTLLAGRLNGEVGGGIHGILDSDDDPSSIQGINLQYNAERGLYGGAGWYRVEDDDLKTVHYSKGGREDTANIWTVNAGYRFGSKFNLWGAYADNTKADYEKNSWQVQLDWGNYVSELGIAKGDWGFWTGYRRYGTNTSFSPLEDDVMKGTKGWFVGGAYAPLDNIGIMVKYFNGDFVTDGGDAEKFMTLVELFY
ncbi:MAG: S-layer homology domain-containing protein [Selenomonadaceae bacterium]|nr:S-layer homology domain-containing protein [Selenomonadaceae bacterium]